MSKLRSSRAAVVILAAALAVAGCARREPAPEPIRSVKTLTVRAEGAGGRIEYAAEVRARVESRLAFRVGGKLVSRTAEVGQRVRAGEPLARIDASDLELAQSAAAAAMRTAQVQLQQADADFRRYQELRAQGFISAFELERRETALKAAQAQLEQARAQAEVQRNQTGYGVLTAPVAGVVTAVEAEVGTVLAAGTPVLRLAHDGPRDVAFAVPEDRVAAMRTLLGRAGALEVRPWGASAPLPASVREVAAAADPVTRTFLVKADIGAAPLQLGQTVTVLIEQPALAGVTKLPLSAVTRQGGQTAVWLVDPATMTVSAQPVVVAGAEGNQVIVASGLRPGQIVVTAGVHVLTPGQKVALFAAPPPPATPPATPAIGGATPNPAATAASR